MEYKEPSFDLLAQDDADYILSGVYTLMATLHGFGVGKEAIMVQAYQEIRKQVEDRTPRFSTQSSILHDTLAVFREAAFRYEQER